MTARTGRQRKPLTGHTDWVCAIAPVRLPDGRTLLATGSNERTVRLWDLANGRPAGLLHLPHRCSALAGLPGGHLAVGYGNETAVLAVHPTSDRAASVGPVDA